MNDDGSVPRYVVRTKDGDKGPLTAQEIAEWSRRGLPLQANIQDRQTNALVTVASVVASVQAQAAEPKRTPEPPRRAKASTRANLGRARARAPKHEEPDEEEEDFEDEPEPELERGTRAREGRRRRAAPERKTRAKGGGWMQTSLGCFGILAALIVIGYVKTSADQSRRESEAAQYKQEAIKVLTEGFGKQGYEEDWIRFIVEKHQQDCLLSSYKSGNRYTPSTYDPDQYAKAMAYYVLTEKDKPESETGREFQSKYGHPPRLPH